MAEISKKIVLHYTKETVGEPIVYTLAKDYDMVFNIIKASVNPDNQGFLAIQLCGDEENYKKSLKYLKERSVKVAMFSENVYLDEDKCMQCGACTGVCPSGALSLDPVSRELIFCGEKCVVCNMCVEACPVNAVSLDF